MSDERAKLIEKVKKLLKLAEGRASIEESEAAAAKAQELIDRYKIAQAELEFAGAPKETLGQVALFHLSDDPRGRALSRLAQTAAPVYDCFAYSLQQGGDKWAVLVGQRTDCELATQMLWFLEKAIDGEARKPWVRSLAGRHSVFSFRLGMVDRLVERLAGVRDGLRSGASQGALIALRDRASDAEAKVRSFGGIRTRSEKVRIDPEAEFMGRLAADRVELVRSLGGAA